MRGVVGGWAREHIGVKQPVRYALRSLGQTKQHCCQLCFCDILSQQWGRGSGGLGVALLVICSCQFSSGQKMFPEHPRLTGLT